MTDPIDRLLEQIYAHGLCNDAGTDDRSLKMFNITPSTGRFLDLLIRDSQPKRVLEIGTSNGYSTIWIGRACRVVQATFDTIEHSLVKMEFAYENIRRAGLSEFVKMIHADAGGFIREAPDQEYDLVFLDSDRRAYVHWLNDLLRITRFGQIVIDNATTHPEELEALQRCIGAHRDLSFVVLPIGNGQMIVTRSREIGSREAIGSESV